MTIVTNGADGPTAPPLTTALCQKSNGKGLHCRRELNHAARCRFAEAPKVRPPRTIVAKPVQTRPRINIIIVGGEPDAREAVAKFVLWALEGIASRDVDSTFIDPPRSSVEAATALEGYHLSIRNAGG